MDGSKSVVELVAQARASVAVFEDRISEVSALMGAQKATEAQAGDLRAATVGIEAAAVDIFTLFEARMQHHFKRGPFSRKLKALLLEAGRADLADRVYQYYLAINVLKHGKGASHRELLAIEAPLFDVKRANPEDEEPTGLVDVSAAGFFDGVSKTILEAYDFLENRTA